MLKEYKSKNSIKAIQVTESLFDTYRKANEAQDLPIKEVFLSLGNKFCTLNCDNNTLVYQGIVLNVGDYLIKSGSSYEPCPKEKFEDEFGIDERVCGDVNCELEETIEKVEEIIKENPETAGFLGKVKDMVKQLLPQDQTTLVGELQNELVFMKQQLEKFLDFSNIAIEKQYEPNSENLTLEELVDLSISNMRAYNDNLRLAVSEYYHIKCENEDTDCFVSKIKKIAEALTLEPSCIDNKLKDTVANAETEEETRLRLSEQITYLMGVLNIKSVERKEEEGVFVNEIAYFTENNN